MKLFIAILALVVSTANAGEYCAKSPIEALKYLSEAYKSKDIENSVNVIDFDVWAESASNNDGIEISAKELKEEYKNHLKKDGFPVYAGLTCTYTQIQTGEVVVVQEYCEFNSGGSYTISYIAVESSCGWKLGGSYMPNNTLQPTQKPRG